METRFESRSLLLPAGLRTPLSQPPAKLESSKSHLETRRRGPGSTSKSAPGRVQDRTAKQSPHWQQDHCTTPNAHKNSALGGSQGLRGHLGTSGGQRYSVTNPRPLEPLDDLSLGPIYAHPSTDFWSQNAKVNIPYVKLRL